ncbi:MAG: glycine zipper family protein [Paracoccaceae bacterium]|nr:glycine zipper family protein [Paracoccaceae bacterium]MDG2258016.1 glycine zipper family protein [Paracoccaceae bacterium]
MSTKFTKLPSIIASVLLLAGCNSNLADYTPVVDPSKTNMGSFKDDLVQCRGIAVQAKAAYDEQASKEAMTNLVAGAVSGAIAGAIVGSGSSYQNDWVAYGAASGAASGASASAQYAELARFGPNRIVDRCMTNRGYALLSDLGTGTNY